jgi:GNAT superfamily N-acetyltransferase
MDKVAIRPARLEEMNVAADLRGVMASEMGRHWDCEHPGWRVRFATFFREKQASGNAQFFFAENGGDIVGMAAVSVLDEYRALAFGQPRAIVNSVFVIPAVRRRGIARRLMEAAIEWARGRGCAMLRLRTSVAGRPLYESLGFVLGTEMELEL